MRSTTCIAVLGGVFLTMGAAQAQCPGDYDNPGR